MIEENIKQPFILVNRQTGKEVYVDTDTEVISWDETCYEKRSAAPTKQQQLLNKILNKG